MALLTMLILLWSKKGPIRSPHPHWPPAPSPRPFLTVESPIRKRVGSFGLGAVDGEGDWERARLMPQNNSARATGKAQLRVMRLCVLDKRRSRVLNRARTSGQSFCLDILLFLWKETAGSGPLPNLYRARESAYPFFWSLMEHELCSFIGLAAD